jgi:hypothetical protein
MNFLITILTRDGDNEYSEFGIVRAGNDKEVRTIAEQHLEQGDETISEIRRIREITEDEVKTLLDLDVAYYIN